MLKHKKFIIIIVLLLIAVVLYIFNPIALIKEIKAKHEVKTSRSAAEKTADESVRKQIEFLNQNNLVLEEITSSKIDVCYVTHRDEGWFAASWYQNCYLRYVEGFTTSLDKTTLQNRLQLLAATNYSFQTLFGEIDKFEHDCNLYEKNFSTTLVFRLANMSRNRDAAIRGLIDSDCEIPNPFQGASSVSGPIMLDNELSTKIYSNFDAEKINNSTNQIWIMHEEEYYHEELGCKGIIFCSNPRINPVMAD